MTEKAKGERELVGEELHALGERVYGVLEKIRYPNTKTGMAALTSVGIRAMQEKGFSRVDVHALVDTVFDVIEAKCQKLKS